jgi:uncharacterized membrane protein
MNSASAFTDWAFKGIETASIAIELLAVAIIVISVGYSTIVYVRTVLHKTATTREYDWYKRQLARGLLLGLEILVAADVVRTVALEPSLRNVGVLGLLVLIRTFLSWSLVVETEHRLPWRPRTTIPPESNISTEP